ncbi:MAG: alpha/beta hydrolase [Synergistaceae bacterium]|jgi:acetyl esterase/lipase|nr:alpha/beta hydrolase [Synergistaceae bacterium]
MVTHEVKILKNMVYTKTDREYLTADVFLPENKRGVPCMVLLHGGGWKFGNADAYNEWGIALAQRGVCAMSINYRVSTVDYPGWPGCLDDVEAATSFLVSHAHEWDLDPYSIGFMGDSSGAHLGFMATLRHEYASHKIRLIVGAYGVYDVGAWGEYAGKKWTRQPNVVVNLLGKPLQDRKSFEEASPYYLIDRALEDNPLLNPEILLLWGEQDNFVPCASQSAPFAEKLKKTRLHVETMALPDAAHLWFPRDITSCEINELDKYPLSVVAPKVLDFITGVFAKPRFTHPNYTGGYENSAAFRKTRFKDSDPLKAVYGYVGSPSKGNAV